MQYTMLMQKSNLHGLTVVYDDQQEFHSLKNEIFTQHCYYVESDNPTPRIIDAGAHIGLATLYFKKQFPGAQIIAIEPHSANIRLLEENVFENNLEEVTVVAGALHADHLYTDDEREWLSTTSIHRGTWTGDQPSSTSLPVTRVELVDFLTEPVDILKMDIEGAEQEVLESARHHLHLINHIFVEFHPTPTQSLDKVMDLLAETGFRLKLSKQGKPVRHEDAKGLVMIEGTRK